MKRNIFFTDEGGFTVCECFIDLDRDISLGGVDEVGRRSLDSAGSMVLEVEYHRELLSRGTYVTPDTLLTYMVTL